MIDKDITNKVEFSNNDGESLSLIACVCSKEYPSWKFIISTDQDHPKKCNHCG